MGNPADSNIREMLTEEYEYNKEQYKYNKIEKTPHKCPVCNGSGLVPSRFYSQSPYWGSTTITSNNCRSCNGSGILWG